MNLQLFRKHSLSSLAKELEMSPFDLVRYLGFNGGLKSDLSFAKDYGPNCIKIWNWNPGGISRVKCLKLFYLIKMYPTFMKDDFNNSVRCC